MVTILKKLLLIFVLLSFSGWTKIGLNFRGSSGYVTDSANQTYVLAADTYPTTRATVTFGWVDAIEGAADRDNAIDVRLAGINYQSNTGTQKRFQVDLPATGSYKICVAIGDATSGQNYARIDVLDNVTGVFSVIDTDGPGGGAPGTFDDAFGTSFTAAAWPGGNGCKTAQIFASTTLIVKVGSTTSQLNASTLAHFYIEQESSSNAPKVIAAEEY